MAVDLFANAANTTLTAALTAGATSLTVTSSTPFPAVSVAAGTQFRVIIDAELFIVTNVTGTTWTVTPGAEGTTQAAHLINAPVTAIVTSGALRGLATGQTVVTKRFTYTAVAGDYVLADTTSRSVADGTTTISSTTVGSATAAFVAGDVGRGITGTGIPALATIVSITSATAVVISAPATATGSALALVIGGAFTVTIPVLTTTQRISVKNIGAGAVTIAATTGTVDGAPTVGLPSQYQARDLVGDGTNLYVA